MIDRAGISSWEYPAKAYFSRSERGKRGALAGKPDVFRLRVSRRSFSLWTSSRVAGTDGWLGSSEPEPVRELPIGSNSLFFLTRHSVA